MKRKLADMAEEIYHLRIKKSYAADVIEDLQKMDAVELLQEPPTTALRKIEVHRNEVLENIKAGLEEVRLFKKGKLKTTPAKDFLHEL